MNRQITSKWVGLFCAAILLLATTGAEAQPAARERTSINAGWRFTKGDPDGTGDALKYENMKAWMMSTGEDLVRDADATRHPRPAGNVGQDVAYTKPDFDDSSWRQLNLPHDWAIEGPFTPSARGDTGKLPFAGIGWYRKRLMIPASDEGKRFYLDIDGAMSYANVWLNGQYAGGWAFGYSSFRIDLTPFIKPGDANVLSIRLDNPDRSSRWYPGAGLHRNVWLVKTSPIHVAQYGTQITTPQVSSASAEVRMTAMIENKSAADINAVVHTDFYAIDVNDQRVGPAIVPAAPISVAVSAGKQSPAQLVGTINNPKLWSIKTPNRYVAVTRVEQNGRAVDSYETTFGIRSVTFDPQKGMILNGEAIKFQGVNNHHDLGALGGAVNTRALQRQLEILQQMGCNSIRTSHNPPAPELLDLADKMGFVVIDESFDCWARGKNPNDYTLLFKDWSEKDQRALVRRDRNHPSVVIWSIGNEVGELGRPDEHHVAVWLARIVREEDSTRPITASCHADNYGYNGFQNVVDVFGYNYLRGTNRDNQISMYSRFQAANPTKMVFSSESASTISTRGVYVFPPMDQFNNKAGGGTPDGQMSSYDLYAPPWAQPPDWEFEAQDKSSAAGEFVWTGFDYLGEPTRNGLGGGGRGRRGGAPTSAPASAPTAGGAPAAPITAPIPARSSYFGIIDLAGFPKDRYYIYQARWRPELAMAHILPHWNWPERAGQVTPVHVYTSGDEGELFLNGQSLGRKKRGQFEYRLRWDDVKYEPGQLKVVTYKNSRPWAEAFMKTTGDATALSLKPDRDKITSDGQDLSFVTVSVTDKDGAMVPKSMNLLKFEVSGPGEIVAVDNGDPMSHEPFQATQMKAFNGLCLVIIRGKPGQSGAITVKAVSDGLTAGQAAITSSPGR